MRIENKFARFVEEWKINLMSLAILFHFLCAIYTNAKSSIFTEKDDRCGNSTTQSQAPDDGYINVRNMLST